jgi:hypothetical protein
MLNPDRIRTKLQDISRCLERLRRLGKADRDAFLSDEDAQDIINVDVIGSITVIKDV